MKTTVTRISAAMCIAFISAAIAQGQMPPPGPEMDVLKKDSGNWECEIKAWAAPGEEPTVTKGSEKNFMFAGGYWLVSNFEGNMFGNDFRGHGTYGYDPTRKKYVGTWIDSLGPYLMVTEGDYDESTKTLTMVGESPGPDGETPFLYTMTTCYESGRVMTMRMRPKGSAEDKNVKLFEMTYTRKQSASSK